MPLVTDRDKQVIHDVLADLKGMVGYQDDVARLYALVSRDSVYGVIRSKVACEIAVAFIRLSEDLKQSLRNLRVDLSMELKAEPSPDTRDPRVDSLEAQVSANKSRIEELEKQFASLVGIVSVRALENLSQEE